MKRCSKCGEEKPLDGFRVHDGATRRRASICTMCHNKHMKAYCRAKYATVEGRAKQMHTSSKSRAQKRNIDFDVSLPLLTHFVQQGYCMMSGLPFDMQPPKYHKTNPLAPSIDRKVSSKGYVDSNIQVICNALNMGKSDHDELDFIAMCVAVAERHADDPAVIQRLKELRNAEF